MFTKLLPPCCLFLLVLAGSSPAAGRYLEVSYPASAEKGELQMGVT